MNDRYRTARIVELDRFIDVGEAMFVKNLLEGHDIRAVIDGEAMAGLFGSYMGPNIAGVRVRVFDSDLERARDILAREREHDEEYDDAAQEEPAAETNLEDSFAAGDEFLGTERNIPRPDHFEEEDPSASSQSTAASDTPPHAVASVEEIPSDLMRAWRASCLSIVLFPILMNCYSLWLLWRAPLSTGQPINWRFYATLLLNGFVLFFYGVLLVVFLTSRPENNFPRGLKTEAVEVRVHIP